MSMFDNYTDLREDYIPNNTTSTFPYARRIFQKVLPIKEENIVGKFVGCSWNYGDTLELRFDINPKIMVERDAIVFETTGYAPTETTEGYLGQRAYNTEDIKSWVCKTLDKNEYVWEEDKEFTFPQHGEQEITLHLFDLEGKTAQVTISNFRVEEMCSFDTQASDVISIFIDKETSLKLLKGVYYSTVKIFDNTQERSDDDIKVIYQYTLIVK